jgi:hypothetical protein
VHEVHQTKGTENMSRHNGHPCPPRTSPRLLPESYVDAMTASGQAIVLPSWLCQAAGEPSRNGLRSLTPASAADPDRRPDALSLDTAPLRQRLVLPAHLATSQDPHPSAGVPATAGTFIARLATPVAAARPMATEWVAVNQLQ